MIENVMHHIGGVEVFGVISICIFFAFFAGMLLWAFCLKKNYLHSMQSLPLDDGASDRSADSPGRAESACCGNTCTCADKAVRAPKLN